MKRFSRAIGSIIFGASATVAGCTAGDEPVVISGDYPYYHSPQELWDASTLVVEAALAPEPHVALHSFMPDAPDLREPRTGRYPPRDDHHTLEG